MSAMEKFTAAPWVMGTAEDTETGKEFNVSALSNEVLSVLLLHQETHH